MQKIIKSAYSNELVNVYGEKQQCILIPDIHNERMRTTVKLCMNQYKRTGEGQNNVVFQVLDWCRNCGAEPLADEILSYIGVPVCEYTFTFSYTFVDRYFQLPNAHKYRTTRDIRVKMRTYIWKQIDKNPPICAISVSNNHYTSMLKHLNKGIPHKQRARFIHNSDDVECYALGPPKLVRDSVLNGPPFEMGIVLGPNDEELENDDPYIEQLYWTYE